MIWACGVLCAMPTRAGRDAVTQCKMSASCYVIEHFEVRSQFIFKV